MILNKLNSCCQIRLIEFIWNVPTKRSKFSSFLRRKMVVISNQQTMPKSKSFEIKLESEVGWYIMYIYLEHGSLYPLKCNIFHRLNEVMWGKYAGSNKWKRNRHKIVNGSTNKMVECDKPEQQYEGKQLHTTWVSTEPWHRYLVDLDSHQQMFSSNLPWHLEVARWWIWSKSKMQRMVCYFT